MYAVSKGNEVGRLKNPRGHIGDNPFTQPNRGINKVVSKLRKICKNKYPEFTVREINTGSGTTDIMVKVTGVALTEGFFKKKEAVDVEVDWGGGKEIHCALLDPNNHDDAGMRGSITLQIPQKFLDGDDEGTSDKDLLDYVRKEIQKPLKKKGFKLNNIELH